MNITKRVLLIFLSLAICFCASACFFKSDEQKIEERIDAFVKAYNSGDMDGVINCMDAKSRNAYKAGKNIGNMLIGKTGYGIDLSDMFALGITLMSEDDVMVVSDKKISITEDTKATVNVVITYNEPSHTTKSNAVFVMVKEDGDWYIKDLKER